MNEITAYNHGREDAMGDLGDRLARVTKQRDALLVAAREVIFDLAFLVSRQGPGPDKRLETLQAAIAAVEGEK